LYDSVLTEFVDLYSKDLILSCFGDEAELYAEDFKITETFYKKYTATILENIDIIRNKNIVDIGCATGVWSILMCMHGARSVISIEPRYKFSKGLEVFLNKHKFPITPVTDFHTATKDHTVDTAVMMGIADLIPDLVTFMTNLKSSADWVILTNKVFDYIPDNNVEIVTEPNVYHRAGFNFTDLQSVDSITGNQTDIFKAITDTNSGCFLRCNFGANYFKTLAQYLGYSIEKNYSPENSDFRIHVLNLKT